MSAGGGSECFGMLVLCHSRYKASTYPVSWIIFAISPVHPH